MISGRMGRTVAFRQHFNYLINLVKRDSVPRRRQVPSFLVLRCGWVPYRTAEHCLLRKARCAQRQRERSFPLSD